MQYIKIAHVLLLVLAAGTVVGVNAAQAILPDTGTLVAMDQQRDRDMDRDPDRDRDMDRDTDRDMDRDPDRDRDQDHDQDRDQDRINKPEQ